MAATDASSVYKLCRHFIYCAIQRCRKSDELCRLSVALKSSPLSDPQIVQISISDTGVGSCLEEFQDLMYAPDPALGGKWDGVISVATTSFCDDEIYHYRLNLKESVSERRLFKLPSRAKNDAKFSGTEVSLSTSEIVDDLLAEITLFLQKMLILKIPKVAIELMVDCGDLSHSCFGNVILANDCTSFSPASSIEHLKSGLEDYIFKHGNSLENICRSCFSTGASPKVQSGVACCAESKRSAGQVTEAVIIVSESSDSTSPSCLRACDTKTEVLYFEDFSPCSVSHSILNALTSVNWKSYGLTLKCVLDQDGYALLEWENLPPDSHIDIAIHCYNKQVTLPPVKQKAGLGQSLVKKAIKLALNDLKEKNAGVLLSAHALKICSYAPDLAKTISGLILSSNDSNFQGECISLLGLQGQNFEKETVENCVKEKIISVIELNDRKPQRSREAAPPLFEDGYFQEPEFLYEDFEEGASSILSYSAR